MIDEHIKHCHLLNASEHGGFGSCVGLPSTHRNNVWLCTQRNFCKHILQNCAFTFGKVMFMSNAMRFFAAQEVNFTFPVLRSEIFLDSQQSDFRLQSWEVDTALTWQLLFCAALGEGQELGHHALYESAEEKEGGRSLFMGFYLSWTPFDILLLLIKMS